MVAFVSGMEAIARTIFKLRDPRWYQVFVLSLLLGFGILVLDFGIHWQNAVAIFVAAQVTQLLGARFIARIPYEPLSALITSYSLTLLLRTDLISLAVLAAAIAIGSKFLVRVRGKHVFNPANVALVSLMLLSNNAWVSSGQWGSATIGALALACLGMLVLTKARRAETTLAFIAAYGLLLVGRALWLGDPLSIPLHQLQNGALLIFAFFMISDPKTSPNSPLGRVLFGTLVASIAYTIQFIFYEPNGPILALIIAAPVVPLIDMVTRGRVYRWDRPVANATGSIKGV
jgi:Na+-translocating ferredoxin:NAD+ oxidoreductase RnfD subunit